MTARKTKVYYNSDRTRRMFYDPAYRLWTMLDIDEDGDQEGSVSYYARRKVAFERFESKNDLASCLLARNTSVVDIVRGTER